MSPREFARSPLFERTFQEGMDLVEEAAAYLEGPGRQEAKTLETAAALLYAGESMRLTTRLMQVASWLLVHRAVRDGEMSEAEAREERYRVTPLPVEAEDIQRHALPTPLLDLVARAERLSLRVSRLDERMFGARATVGGAEPAGNPVADQWRKLRDAFGETHVVED
jgi:regulator of CtrA degradation